VDDRALLERAAEARRNSYAPYSRFTVGAALLARSGAVFVGVNVENASYGATICAERAAVTAAVAAGEREFEAIAVIADTDGPVRPCGVCRQVLAEFGGATRVVMGNLAGDVETLSIADLLPAAFRFKRAPGGA
jgi:cytidine deaminase